MHPTELALREALASFLIVAPDGAYPVPLPDDYWERLGVLGDWLEDEGREAEALLARHWPRPRAPHGGAGHWWSLQLPGRVCVVPRKALYGRYNRGHWVLGFVRSVD